MQRQAVAKQGARPIRIWITRKLGRSFKRPGSCCIRVQRERASAGGSQRRSYAWFELRRCRAGRSRELQRTLVVVGEQLGLVLRSAERFDPFGRSAVLVAAL
jgi:hypothetical protein